MASQEHSDGQENATAVAGGWLLGKGPAVSNQGRHTAGRDNLAVAGQPHVGRDGNGHTQPNQNTTRPSQLHPLRG